MSLMARDDEPTEFEEGPGSKVLRCAPRWATIQTWAVSKRTVFFVALTSERQYDWLVNGLPARHDAFDTPIKLCTGSLCRRLNLCVALFRFLHVSSSPWWKARLPLEICLTHSLTNTHIKGEFLGSHHFPPTLPVSIPHQIDTQSEEMKLRRFCNLLFSSYFSCSFF